MIVHEYGVTQSSIFVKVQFHFVRTGETNVIPLPKYKRTNEYTKRKIHSFAHHHIYNNWLQSFKVGCSGEKDCLKIKMVTECREIIIEVESKKAPITATNFLKYIDENRYRIASFYQAVNLGNQPEDSIKIQVIQGGIGFIESTLRLAAITHETTKETGITRKNGVISMARNKPGSASSEIFICIGDQPELDYGVKRNPNGRGFAAFDRVIRGMQVFRKIQNEASEGQMLKSSIKTLYVRRI